MGSYKGESSVFTGNSTGGSPGESSGLKKTSMPGGSHLAAYPQDNIHGVNLKGVRGERMGGSEKNLAHSLSGGVSAVQDTAHPGGKSGKPEI